MASRHGYSEKEMARMQQDAISRAREMQSRTRTAGEGQGQGGYIPPPNYSGHNFRNWSTNPNVQRPRSQGGKGKKEQAPPPPPPSPPPPPPPPEPEPPEPPIPDAPDSPKDTTLIQDVLEAVGIDDDRLLILGLLFLLINAKADTTLILALIYLLI